MEKSMKVIKPLVLTDAMLVSSTAPETDHPEWSAVTAYTVGVKCIRASTHRIYERRVAGTTATAPELDPENWLDVGPTNRHAMFDAVVGTSTAVASPLTVVLRPGSVSGLALMELAGAELTVAMTAAPGGTTVYERTISLDGTIIESVYDWFYTEYEQRTDVVLTDLPFHFPGCELTISITAPAGGVACGVCKFGEVIEIGATRYGAGVEIMDFSRKEQDAFGRYAVVERAYSKRVSLSVLTEKGDFNRIFRRIAALRATPCIYIATEDGGYQPLIAYGFYKGFSIVVEYPAYHDCSLTVESLI